MGDIVHAVIRQTAGHTGPGYYFRIFFRTSQSCLRVQTIIHLLPLITIINSKVFKIHGFRSISPNIKGNIMLG